jgi:aryl-alcohol dehydrogenase-like predicted oxidoreductase
MLNQRPLGRTGLTVTELGLGGLFISSFGAEYDAARAAIHRALELGINYVDTAPGYRDSEAVLGRALEDVTRPYILSTKLGGRPQPFKPQDYDCLMASVEESLRLLKRDRIDLLMIHEPDRPGQYDWWADKRAYDGPVMRLLDDLRRQGIVRYIGIGGTTAYEMAHVIRTGKFDVVLMASIKQQNAPEPRARPLSFSSPPMICATKPSLRLGRKTKKGSPIPDSPLLFSRAATM